MLRVATSLILIATQAVLGAPLYVCSSAGGEVRFDSGPAACIGCSSDHLEERDDGGCCSLDRAAESPTEGFRSAAPCNCRHEPLCDGVQYVQRQEIVVASLPVTGIDQFAVDPLTGRLFAALDFTACSDRTSLADLTSVRLRC